jgi:hypothetical protein
LSLKTLLKFIYFLCVGGGRLRYIDIRHELRQAGQLDMSRMAMVDWSNFLRDVCQTEMLTQRQRIGGVGHIVEVDESLILVYLFLQLGV